MRFYTKPHTFCGGIDWHARTMYACLLDQPGEITLHRNLQAHAAAIREASTVGLR